ncbi:hypothetical protein COCCADRAFT_21837 [Bipolaris zeicola 26-R-13]|uniref:Uncharacterized protein n=1 Tax=Cochliobolus carbonum (strain 26-R-13) TaxID=930089 RepID=W6YM25_COCC2|nr:uncharacterized protein COCCADRAFT_21837 [Bipolaris zeicola 26-R-13]EUC38795.1 hypothetical protein COCCADRAFT_21837 [Bipolaris zeicola 26-R-13]
MSRMRIAHMFTYLHGGETDGQIAMRYVRFKSTELAGGTLLHSTMALFAKDAREKNAISIEELFSLSRVSPCARLVGRRCVAPDNIRYSMVARTASLVRAVRRVSVGRIRAPYHGYFVPRSAVTHPLTPGFSAVNWTLVHNSAGWDNGIGRERVMKDERSVGLGRTCPIRPYCRSATFPTMAAATGWEGSQASPLATGFGCLG